MERRKAEREKGAEAVEKDFNKGSCAVYYQKKGDELIEGMRA